MSEIRNDEQIGTRNVDLSGWGRYPSSTARVARPEKVAQLRPAAGPSIARGQGRSYGDAALNAGGTVLLTERVDRLLAFDESAGRLRAEAGVTLAEILSVTVPRGWFLPVTPGTKLCSLGGCLAADVHGKNHHRDGTLSAHVEELELVLADGSRRRCSPRENAELFWATAGGMGLTGIITAATTRLQAVESAYMAVEHRRAKDLDAVLELLAGKEGDAHYTVAWIDCLASGRRLGRSVFMSGRHATAGELPRKTRESRAGPLVGVPFDLPGWTLNPLTIGAFNQFYYLWQGAKGRFLTHYDHFFYPLDAVGGWNRMYGKRGFVQYQFVLPAETSGEGMPVILEELARSRRASFLAVLKRFGPEGEGYLSFPREGYTLALDIPVSDGLFALLDKLDDMVLGYGGRVYLAKDAHLGPETFRAMYPRLAQWRHVKSQVDPDNRFSSDLARRLEICS